MLRTVFGSPHIDFCSQISILSSLWIVGREKAIA